MKLWLSFRMTQFEMERATVLAEVTSAGLSRFIPS